MILGDEVVYLDPHTTQLAGSVHQKLDENEVEMDATYHCKYASRIPITGMDPSVALVSKKKFHLKKLPVNKYNK